MIDIAGVERAPGCPNGDVPGNSGKNLGPQRYVLRNGGAENMCNGEKGSRQICRARIAKQPWRQRPRSGIAIGLPILSRDYWNVHTGCVAVSSPSLG